MGKVGDEFVLVLKVGTCIYIQVNLPVLPNKQMIFPLGCMDHGTDISCNPQGQNTG